MLTLTGTIRAVATLGGGKRKTGEVIPEREVLQVEGLDARALEVETRKPVKIALYIGSRDAKRQDRFVMMSQVCTGYPRLRRQPDQHIDRLARIANGLGRRKGRRDEAHRHPIRCDNPIWGLLTCGLQR